MSQFARSLFSTPANTVMTLFWVALAYFLIPPFIDWAVLDAVFVAEDGSQCSRRSACWAFIFARFDDFMFGRYPDAERWRVVVGLAVPLAVYLLRDLYECTTAHRGILSGCAQLSVFGRFVLLWRRVRHGCCGDTVVGRFCFKRLSSAATSIASALPIGILLALGRRSKIAGHLTSLRRLYRNGPVRSYDHRSVRSVDHVPLLHTGRG